MNRYFDIQFNDLTTGKQEELIADVKASLREATKTEGERILKNVEEHKAELWFVAPKSWQEAYCRTFSVDWEMWNDLSEVDKEFQDIDWEYTLDEYLEKQAQLNLVKGFKYAEVEVEV